jgi:hypothetical protein
MQFTTEQLIAHITDKAARIKPDVQINEKYRIEALMNLRILEIALATLTAPDGVHSEPEESFTCERCGTTTTRPNGEHYCHAGRK